MSLSVIAHPSTYASTITPRDQLAQDALVRFIRSYAFTPVVVHRMIADPVPFAEHDHASTSRATATVRTRSFTLFPSPLLPVAISRFPMLFPDPQDFLPSRPLPFRWLTHLYLNPPPHLPKCTLCPQRRFLPSQHHSRMPILRTGHSLNLTQTPPSPPPSNPSRTRSRLAACTSSSSTNTTISLLELMYRSTSSALCSIFSGRS
jgi:hypothetical protein